MLPSIFGENMFDDFFDDFDREFFGRHNPLYGRRAKNLMKLDVPRWAAYKIAYSGDRYARLAHNGWVHKAISNERLTTFGLVSMSNYYAERRVIC